MKKIILSLLCLTFSITLFAQKTLPEIKDGTTLKCSAYVQGQEFPLDLTLKSIAGPVTMLWAVEGYGDGAFVMSTKALENATQMYVTTQPATGETKLSDSETFGMISKVAYKALAETKTLTYGGIKFKLKTPDANPMKINGKEIDATHVVSEDGKLELWVLNNPNLPLVLQSAGFPTDIVVIEIK
ncbi:hypothetical protein WG904_08680 [Pedobacter sp. Du54]|uniref:hypothetical protein n=1 Tax=Pedobacter anseongensis TaxID=3133439 RepID=UPI00309E1F60